MDFLKFQFGNLVLEEEYLHDESSLDDVIKNWIQRFSTNPLPCCLEKKPTEQSAIYRAIGDRYMVEEDYNGAIDIYTTGLQECPPFSRSTAHFFAYRAKALEKLGLYRESLLDINRAIELPIAPELLKEIEQKKVELQIKMCRAKAAETNRKTTLKNYYAEVPQLSYKENKDIPGASNAISLAYDNRHGRHLVATKLIQPGDVILIEKPYMTYIGAKKRLIDGMSCCHCSEISKALIPCDHCSDALYCSAECREEEYEKYHKHECTFTNLSGSLRCVLRLFLILTENGAKVEEVKTYCKELDGMNENAIKELCAADKIVGSDMKSILNLSLRMKKNQKSLYQNAAPSAALATMLRNYSKLKLGNDILGLAKVICRLFYIFDSYYLIIEDHRANMSPGVGIYSILSLIRHSCSSNTLHSMHKDNVLVLHACKSIKPGEKITFNFIDPLMRFLDGTDRRGYLSSVRHIACQCEICTRSYSFKPELRRKLDIPARLQRRLRKSPADVDSLWELLKIINREIERPCIETEIVKVAITNAYVKREFSLIWGLYNAIGVL